MARGVYSPDFTICPGTFLAHPSRDAMPRPWQSRPQPHLKSLIETLLFVYSYDLYEADVVLNTIRKKPP